MNLKDYKEDLSRVSSGSMGSQVPGGSGMFQVAPGAFRAVSGCLLKMSGAFQGVL